MALTKFNYNSFDVTPVASKALAFNSGANGFTTAAEGSMVLIKTLTASSDATLSFVDGTDDVVLDNTYPIYLFKFMSAHNETDFKDLQFQANVAGGSGYDETITSTSWYSQHNEGDTAAAISYETGRDQAQGTGFQSIVQGAGNDNDQSSSGELWLFNPSSTTFVKHFLAKGNCSTDDDYAKLLFVAGYINTTSAIDEIQFKLAGGDIDAGTFKLYGIKDS